MYDLGTPSAYSVVTACNLIRYKRFSTLPPGRLGSRPLRAVLKTIRYPSYMPTMADNNIYLQPILRDCFQYIASGSDSLRDF
jgi:hypothetical protein